MKEPECEKISNIFLQQVNNFRYSLRNPIPNGILPNGINKLKLGEYLEWNSPMTIYEIVQIHFNAKNEKARDFYNLFKHLV